LSLTQQQEEAAALVASDHLSDEAICQQVGVRWRRTLWKWRQLPEFAAAVEQHRATFRAAVRERGIALMERRIDRLNRTWLRLQQVVEARAEAHADEDAPGASTGLLVRQVKLVKVYDAGELVPTEIDEELEGQPQGGALRRRRKDPPPDLSIRKLLETGILPGANDDVVFDVEDYKGGVLYSAKKSVQVVEWTLDKALLQELREVEKQAAIELGQWQADETAADQGTARVTITKIAYHQPPTEQGA
jgi:hypothetical protein